MKNKKKRKKKKERMDDDDDDDEKNIYNHYTQEVQLQLRMTTIYHF
jgi:hypothetical protein